MNISCILIKSEYLYAIQSMEDKKKERLEQVLTDCNDFNDRFPGKQTEKTGTGIPGTRQ